MAAAFLSMRNRRLLQRIARVRAPDSSSCRVAVSFPNAKAAENLAEQIIRGEFAGDGGKRRLREAQLFGEELPLQQLLTRGSEMAARALQCPQVPLPREEHRFPSRRPSCRREDCGAQLFHALT